MKKKLIVSTLSGAMLAGTALTLPAQAGETLSGIMCGNEVPEARQKVIAEWKEKNNVEVNIELVPWGQCQNKVFTLAAAGSPPDFATVGSRRITSIGR